MRNRSLGRIRIDWLRSAKPRASLCTLPSSRTTTKTPGGAGGDDAVEQRPELGLVVTPRDGAADEEHGCGQHASHEYIDCTRQHSVHRQAATARDRLAALGANRQ